MRIEQTSSPIGAEFAYADDERVVHQVFVADAPAAYKVLERLVDIGQAFGDSGHYGRVAVAYVRVYGCKVLVGVAHYGGELGAHGLIVVFIDEFFRFFIVDGGERLYHGRFHVEERYELAHLVDEVCAVYGVGLHVFAYFVGHGEKFYASFCECHILVLVLYYYV